MRFHRVLASEEVDPGHGVLAGEVAGKEPDAEQAEQGDDDHQDDAGGVDHAVGNEVEQRKGVVALFPPDGGEEQGEEGPGPDDDRAPEHRLGVEDASDAALVVMGDGVPPGGAHELARVGFLRAPVGAQAAAVAGPEFLAADEVVGEPDLGQPDELAGEHGVVVR